MSVNIFTDPGMTAMLADFTRYPVSFSTSKHGFAAASQFVPMTLQRAFAVLDWPGTPHAVISNRYGDVVWEGRWETPSLVSGGIRWTAYGYWQAMRDVPYTALWSDSSVKDWDRVTDAMVSSRKPEKHVMDNNNRLFIGLRKNEIYANVSDAGAWYFELPDGGQQNDIYFTCDYAFNAPTNFNFRISSYNSGFTSIVTENNVASAGTLLSGSLSLTITSGKTILEAYIYNNTGGNYTNTSETGAYYLKLTNIRIKTASGDVLASDIASALVTYTNGINSSQLQTGTALIEATTEDLFDEVYEDEYPADILDDLALRHGYEVGVWEDRTLFFRAKGSAGRTWYIDAKSIELEPDLGGVYNSTYATYRDENGFTLRTETADNDNSIERYGITRRDVISARTTSATQAEAERDAHLTDLSNYAIRAIITFDRLTDESGGIHDVTELRAWDTLTVRNLPPTLGSVVDEIRTFKLGGTTFNEDGSISVEPETPIPTLVTLIAQKGAGQR